MVTDGHVHTTYSDGSELPAMVAAAERADLDAIGLADHCIVTDDPFGRRERFDLVETYDRRREAIAAVRDETALRVYDAAEVSFVADAREATRAFLSRADFEYTIGSVHFAGGDDFTTDAAFADADADARRAAVERYYDAVVDLIETGLFDVLGHLDLPERLETLRGVTRPADYDRVAAALADARTVPELNAGRIDGSLGRTHPPVASLQPFRDREIEFVLGTDSHRPDELTSRVPALEGVVDRSAIDVVPVESILS